LKTSSRGADDAFLESPDVGAEGGTLPGFLEGPFGVD
jgi:hypothetical protein